jgi:NADH-quinone oxidoreductase subunit J
MAEWVVFAAGTLLALIGAAGVLTMRNPVHAALFLVQTLFGVAVLFVSLQAHFLAAVQIIVYAGAIVVLFLFVIMLLGVDKSDLKAPEILKGQRVMAAVLGGIALVELLLISRVNVALGAKGGSGSLDGAGTNVEKLSEAVFTKFLFPFEITSILLVIAVVGAVLLSRKPKPLDGAAGSSAGVVGSVGGAA